jgi:hypothetical protein
MIYGSVSPHLGAIPLPNLVFLALIAIVGLLRWISQQAEQAKRKSQQQQGKPQQRQSAPPPLVQKPQDSEEQRVRRFLEALGQPTSSRPPPKIPPRPIASKRAAVGRARPFGSSLPPLTTSPPEMPSPPPLPILVSDDSPPFTPEPAPTPISPAWATDVPLAQLATDKITSTVSDPGLFPRTTTKPGIYPEITKLLKSQRGLRDAIILREVFGPPRSLQAMETRSLG